MAGVGVCCFGALCAVIVSMTAAAAATAVPRRVGCDGFISVEGEKIGATTLVKATADSWDAAPFGAQRRGKILDINFASYGHYETSKFCPSCS